MANSSSNPIRKFARRFALKKVDVNDPLLMSRRKTPTTLADCKTHKNKLEELGNVRFGYSSDTYNAAISEAKDTNKPLLILFDELPGCNTCVRFGRNVLSHPLLVEAMESLFVTVLVNNRGMTPADDLMLNKFHEPRLNNPVLRFIDPVSEKDVAPRVADGMWTVGAVARSMEKALPASPAYLHLLKREYAAKIGAGGSKSEAHATFAMDCFWTGERVFAQLDGVIGTEAGWCGHHEVVRVTYDSDVLTYLALVRFAIKHDMAQIIYVTSRYEREQALYELKNSGATGQVFEIKASSRIRKDSDPKHWLRMTDFRYVPLTALQATKINLALSYQNNLAARAMLSPRQMVILDTVQKKKMSEESVDIEIGTAWMQLERRGVFDDSSKR